MAAIRPTQSNNFQAEYTYYVREEMKRFDRNRDGNLDANEARLGSRRLKSEFDFNMSNLFSALATKLEQKDPNNSFFRDGLLGFVRPSSGGNSELFRLAKQVGSAQVLSQADLNAPAPVTNPNPNYNYRTVDVLADVREADRNFENTLQYQVSKDDLKALAQITASTDKKNRVDTLLANFDKISYDGQFITEDDIRYVAGLDGNRQNFTNQDVSLIPLFSDAFTA